MRAQRNGITSGDMYLIQPKHLIHPSRSEGSLGLVIERKRAGQGFYRRIFGFDSKPQNMKYNLN
jgi:hypothetical protein